MLGGWLLFLCDTPLLLIVPRKNNPDGMQAFFYELRIPDYGIFLCGMVWDGMVLCGTVALGCLVVGYALALVFDVLDDEKSTVRK